MLQFIISAVQYEIQSACNDFVYSGSTVYQYCANSYISNYRNLTVNLRNSGYKGSQELSVFLNLPTVSNLQVTVNSYISASKTTLAHYVYNEVQPIEVTYNIPQTTNITYLYGLTQYVNYISVINSLSVTFNVQNQNIDLLLLCYKVQLQDEEQHMIIKKAQVQGTSSAKSYKLCGSLYNPLDMGRYMYNASFITQSTNYMIFYTVYEIINIKEMMIYGSAIVNGNQQKLLYNNLNGGSVTVEQLVQNIFTNVQQVDNETQVERVQVNIQTPFTLTDQQNTNVKYCLQQQSVFVTHGDIIIQSGLITQLNSSYTLFNKLEQQLVDVNIIYQQITAVNGVFAGLAYTIQGQVLVQNVNLQIQGQGSTSQGAGKIFAISAIKQDNTVLQVQDSELNIQIQRQSSFAYSGLTYDFYPQISLNNLQYKLSITGKNKQSYILSEVFTADQSVNNIQIKFNSMPIELQTDSNSNQYSFYAIKTDTSKYELPQQIVLQIVSFQNVPVNEQESGDISWLDVQLVKPQFYVTDADLKCDEDICYYIDEENLQGYSITGQLTLNTQQSQTKLQLFKNPIDLIDAEIILNLNNQESSFTDFQIFSPKQQSISCNMIQLKLTIGDMIFNGLVGTPENEVSIIIDNYEAEIQGNNNIYGIFDQQLYPININIRDYESALISLNGFVAGIANIASQQVTIESEIYKFETYSLPEDSSIYFVQMNTQDIYIQIDNTDFVDYVQQCPYITTNETFTEQFLQQFSCPELPIEQEETNQDFDGTMEITSFQLQKGQDGSYYYVNYDNQIYGTDIKVNVHHVSQPAPNSEVSIFGNARGLVTNVNIQTDTVLDVQNMKTFSLFSALNGNLMLQNVTTNFNTQGLKHENTQIFGFINSNEGYNISLQDCQFLGQIEAQNVSAIGQMNGGQLEINNFIVDILITSKQGSFVVFEMVQGTTVIINECNILSTSKITGPQVASIGFYAQNSNIQLNQINAQGWVDGQNYTSAGIFSFLYNSNMVSADNVIFNPGQDHSNYYNCYTQPVLGTNTPVGVSCPSIVNREVTELLYETYQYNTSSKHYYAFDNTEENYNNSIIQNNMPLSPNGGNLSYSDFSQLNFGKTTQWNNIQLTGSVYSLQKTKSTFFYAGFIVSTQATSDYTFYNCQNTRDYTSTWSNMGAANSYECRYSGFILEQASAVNYQFIGCKHDNNIVVTNGTANGITSNKDIIYYGFVHTTGTAINYYIGCTSKINDATESKEIGAVILTSTFYPFQQTEGCQYTGAIISATNVDTNEGNKCTENTDLQWW